MPRHPPCALKHLPPPHTTTHHHTRHPPRRQNTRSDQQEEAARQSQAKNPNHKDTEKIYSTKHHNKETFTKKILAMLASTVQFSNNNQTPPRTPQAPDPEHTPQGAHPNGMTCTRQPDEITDPTTSDERRPWCPVPQDPTVRQAPAPPTTTTFQTINGVPKNTSAVLAPQRADKCRVDVPPSSTDLQTCAGVDGPYHPTPRRK